MVQNPSVDLNLYLFIYYLVIIICNCHLTRQIFRIYFFYTCQKSRKIILSLVSKTTRNLINEAAFILSCTAVLAWISVYLGQGTLYFASFIVFLLFQFINKLTPSEKMLLTDIKKLSLGHGAALWYYKNYLDRFLEKNLLIRIKQFMSRQGVELPEKLYVLCPNTCKVQTYIDNTDIIDRCRELPKLIMDNSGIPNREYNITVYRIEHPLKTFRCAIEYAQPLKSLFRFKEMGRITASEMNFQRAEFCRHLKNYLQEGVVANKLCELVEFDDETEEIHDVLYKTESIQKFIKKCSVS